MLVPVTEVVLAELPGGIAVVLERIGDGGVLGLETQLGPRHPHLRQTGAVMGFCPVMKAARPAVQLCSP